jgi:hypothetical protein
MGADHFPAELGESDPGLALAADEVCSMNREHQPPVSIDGQFPAFPPIFLFSFVDENADGFRCNIEILADRFGDVLDKPSLLFDGSALIRLDNDQWHVCVPPAGFLIALELRFPYRMRIGKAFRYVNKPTQFGNMTKYQQKQLRRIFCRFDKTA